MPIKQILAQRIGIKEILEINALVENSATLKNELYGLLFDSDDFIAYQAAWVMTHFSTQENRWLFDKQNELIDEVLVCRHAGKRRLLLNLLYKQPVADPFRSDFLDFCMERMISREELPGVQALCMKLAYELCRTIPELLREFQLMLEIMDPDMLEISRRTVRKNLLKAIRKEKKS
ncbi:hypothetical protein LJC12_01205 [Odoribacter sp. OttesenSCG-928-J03]|nr:hypothetical protein [Odoribacter sp. OttesenSCG-928-J03]MDL2282947.1 hypothetical protein [Odoribacter sp. OttesenSCG-928-G04]